MRPRLVIYNVTLEHLRPALGETAVELDQEAHWAGMSLVLPRLGVSLHLEPSASMRNVQLVSTGPRQNYAGWKRLEHALRPALRETPSAANPFGAVLFIFGMIMATLVAYQTLSQPEAVAAALKEMLRQ